MYGQPMNTLLSPAQLWIGQPEELLSTVTQSLQQFMCAQKGCLVCSTCHTIATQQHYAITWLYPERQYTLEQLSSISSTIVFALQEGEHHFFIIQKAESLTPACSNSLLKSIEEPPPGYHFVLLTSRPQELLTTIRSRCMEHTFSSHEQQVPHPLLAYFTASRITTNPLAFLKTLDQSKINEQETVELLDQLLIQWMNNYKKAILENNQKACLHLEHNIQLIKKALAKPPMPGSSALLWKDLFLQMR